MRTRRSVIGGELARRASGMASGRPSDARRRHRPLDPRDLDLDLGDLVERLAVLLAAERGRVTPPTRDNVLLQQCFARLRLLRHGASCGSKGSAASSIVARAWPRAVSYTHLTLPTK